MSKQFFYQTCFAAM